MRAGAPHPVSWRERTCWDAWVGVSCGLSWAPLCPLSARGRSFGIQHLPRCVSEPGFLRFTRRAAFSAAAPSLPASEAVPLTRLPLVATFLLSPDRLVSGLLCVGLGPKAALLKLQFVLFPLLNRLSCFSSSFRSAAHSRGRYRELPRSPCPLGCTASSPSASPPGAHLSQR